MIGVRIIHSELMADTINDFSACRSPSRAARRLKRGVRGRVQSKIVPFEHAYKLPNGDLVMHPTMEKKLIAMINDPPPGNLMRPYIGLSPGLRMTGRIWDMGTTTT